MKMKNRIAGAAMSGWIESIEFRKATRVLITRVLSRLVNGKVAAAYRSWTGMIEAMKGAAEEAARLEVVLKRAVMKMKNRTTSAVVEKWCEMVEEKKRFRFLLKKAAMKMKNRIVAGAMSGWIDFYDGRVHMRKLIKKVLGRLMNAKVNSGFRAWHDFVHLGLLEAREAQRKLEDAEREEKRKLAVMSRIIKRIQNRTTSGVMNSWCDMVEEKKRFRFLLKKAAMKMKNRIAAAALSSWDEFTQSRQRQRQLINKTIARYTNQEYLWGWMRWKTFTLMDRMQSNGLAEELAGLKEKERLHKMNLVKKVITRLGKAYLYAGFSTWFVRTEALRRYEMMVRKAAGRWKNQTAAAAMMRWEEFAQENKKNRNTAQRALKWWLNRTLNAACNAWTEFTTARKRNRTIVKKAIYRYENQNSLWGWMRWREFVQRDQMREQLEANGLSSASAEEQERLRKLKLVTKVVFGLCNGLLFGAWQTWGEMVRMQKSVEQMAGKAIKRWKNQKIAMIFDRWIDLVEANKHMRFVTKKVVARWKNKLLVGVYNAWVEFLEAGKRRRQLVARAAGKWKNAMMGGAFQGWAETARERKERRIAVKRAVLRMKNRVVCMCVNSWQELVEDKQRVRTLLRLVVNRYNVANLNYGWLRWRVDTMIKKMQGSREPPCECARCGTACPRCAFKVPAVRVGGGWDLSATIDNLERLGHIAARVKLEHESNTTQVVGRPHSAHPSSKGARQRRLTNDTGDWSSDTKAPESFPTPRPTPEPYYMEQVQQEQDGRSGLRPKSSPGRRPGNKDIGRRLLSRSAKSLRKKRRPTPASRQKWNPRQVASSPYLHDLVPGGGPMGGFSSVLRSGARVLRPVETVWMSESDEDEEVEEVPQQRICIAEDGKAAPVGFFSCGVSDSLEVLRELLNGHHGSSKMFSFLDQNGTAIEGQHEGQVLVQQVRRAS